ncbi:MAG: cytidine deaminase [Vicinamibacterales bacterium]
MSVSKDGKAWPDVDRRASDRRQAARRTAQRRTGRDRRSEGAWIPVSLDPSADDVLITAARVVRLRAQAAYSGFKVGAALELPDGTTVGGCNIENATYGLTICAERVALVKALSDGKVTFTRIAVVADTEAPVPPCGPCRQLLWEYCGDIEVLLANLQGPTGRYRLSELLPLPFDNRLLK